ncbi:response regulator [Apiospora arundinis]
MAPRAPPTEQRLGLHRLVPAEGTTDTTTLDIIAIHGLDTESPRTWIWEKNGTQVHWLRDSDMLPAAIPEARIYTYDWDAKVFDHAPVQDLLDHADNLLGQVAAERSQNSEARPLIFVASCFGGLVLAEAICRAAQEGSPYRGVLLATVGAVFLATPFAGTDAAQPALWLVTIKGIMGPDDSQFKLVRHQIQELVSGAKEALRRRRNESVLSHFLVRFSRNEDFVGRETVLEQLLNRIPPSADPNACQRTVIEGLGGIGKTQVAIEAAYRAREAHPDCSVFWVPAVDMTMFENAYREIGQALGVKGIEDDKADVKALVKAALSRDEAGHWLLIIDNIDDIILFTDGQLLTYLPFSRQGSILFTTRNHQAATRFDTRHVIRLEGLDEPEARELLYQRLDERQRGKLEDTAKLLDYLTRLPLAIRQASAYMASNANVTVLKYLSYCQSSDQSMIRMLSKAFDDRGRYQATQNPIAVTWLVSFRHISRDAPLAAAYLRSIAYFAEKDIPISFLPAGEDEMEKDEAISTLQAYAFIVDRSTPDRFDIHRLVRLATRNWVQAQGEQGQQVTGVVQQLSKKFPWPKHENRDIWTWYLPHAQAVLGLRDECGESAVLGSLQHNVAGCYNLLGKYAEAEQMHRQTLGLRETVLGREHPSTLASMNNLAESLRQQGKHAEAEEMHRQTLGLKETVLGREHPSTLDSMNNLAISLRQQGKHAEAEKMHRQTLGLRETVLGREHPSTLASMNNLAESLRQQGKHAEAEEMHRQTLGLKETVLGREHPSTLDSMNNLAVVLDSQGKYAEAEQMHRQTLGLTETVLGREHPSTLSSMNNLAISLRQQGKHAEAEEMHRETLGLKETVLGREHPSTLASMNNLAKVLRNIGMRSGVDEGI